MTPPTKSIVEVIKEFSRLSLHEIYTRVEGPGPLRAVIARQVVKNYQPASVKRYLTDDKRLELITQLRTSIHEIMQLIEKHDRGIAYKYTLDECEQVAGLHRVRYLLNATLAAFEKTELDVNLVARDRLLSQWIEEAHKISKDNAYVASFVLAETKKASPARDGTSDWSQCEQLLHFGLNGYPAFAERLEGVFGAIYHNVQVTETSIEDDQYAKLRLVMSNQVQELRLAADFAWKQKDLQQAIKYQEAAAFFTERYLSGLPEKPDDGARLKAWNLVRASNRFLDFCLGVSESKHKKSTPQATGLNEEEKWRIKVIFALTLVVGVGQILWKLFKDSVWPPK